MAKEYSTRPSSLLGLTEDSFAAWCLDEVTYLWGTHVEAEVAQSGEKMKNPDQRLAAKHRTLSSLLFDGDTEDGKGEVAAAPKGRFRDPASMMGGKRG